MARNLKFEKNKISYLIGSMKWKPIQKKCNLILVRKKKTEFFFCFFFLFLILKGSAVVGAALFPLFTVSLGRSRLRDLPSILRANGSARERETKQHAHLKPTTPPITPLTDDVQKWDDPKERRSVKRMIIYFIFFFFAGFQLQRMRKWGRESDHALTNELFTQKGHAYRFVRDWPRDIDDGWDRPAKSKSNILLPTHPSTPLSISTSSRAEFAQVLPRKTSQIIFLWIYSSCESIDKLEQKGSQHLVWASTIDVYTGPDVKQTQIERNDAVGKVNYLDCWWS